MTVIPARAVTSYGATDLNTFSGGQPRFVFQVARGLDDSPEVRGTDTIIPGRAGRTARSRVFDRRVIEIEGWVFGVGTTHAAQTDDFRDAMETLRSIFDPTAAAATLTVLLEDSTRSVTISCRPTNMIVNYEGMSAGARVSVELEAVSADWASPALVVLPDEDDDEPPIGEETLVYPASDTGKTYVPWGGSLTEPDLGAYVDDPNFEGRIYRVHDTGRAIYPRKPAWNADGTRLVLLNSSKDILDGSTYAVLDNDDNLSVNFVWSATDPDYGFLTRSGGLYSLAPGGAYTLIRSVSGYHLSAEGRQSIDDRYIALQKDDDRGALFYDITADSILGTVAFSSDVDWVTTAPSGDYMLVRFVAGGTSSEQGTWLYAQDGSAIRNINSGQHGDVARDGLGRDIYVGFDGGNYRAYRLDETSYIDILGDQISGHISGCMFARLGWVLISNHYQSDGEPGWDQIIAVKTDGSQTVKPFCHARTIQTNTQYTYALSTHAVPSPDGLKATWGGGWERWTTDEDTPHGYVVEVPAP